eukprot:388928_1
MAQQDESNTLQLPSKMQKYTPDTSKANWKSQMYLPGVATEVETEWNEKLYQKFKQIDNMKGLIQNTINNLDKDYVSEKQKLNDSFASMILLLENRRDLLLNSMHNNVIKYKKDLNSQLSQLQCDRKQLIEVKNQYEENVNNKDLTDIEERENNNVKIVSNALNNCQIKSKLKPKHPSYIINQKNINNQINNFGEFILKTEIPQSPIVCVLVRTSENALIEILMDEKYNDDNVLKYEFNIYKGLVAETEYDHIKENEYLKLYCQNNVIRKNNICFYKINNLDDNESYNIRLRAIFTNNIIGKYSKWLKFKTKPLGSDDDNDDNDENKHNDNNKIISYNAQDEQKIEQAWNNAEINDFDSWLLIFKRIDLGLTVYQQMRIFFCMQQVEQGPGSKIDAGDFANFILSVSQRFDSMEWKNMCKTIRDRILNQ